MASCQDCGSPLEPDVIALNLRLRGRGIGHFDCIPCLAGRLDSTEPDLHEWMDYFKRTHCSLFAPERQAGWTSEGGGAHGGT